MGTNSDGDEVIIVTKVGISLSIDSSPAPAPARSAPAPALQMHGTRCWSLTTATWPITDNSPIMAPTAPPPPQPLQRLNAVFCLAINWRSARAVLFQVHGRGVLIDQEGAGAQSGTTNNMIKLIWKAKLITSQRVDTQGAGDGGELSFAFGLFWDLRQRRKLKNISYIKYLEA